MSWTPDEWALDKIMAQVCPICGKDRSQSGKPLRQVLTHIAQAHGYSGQEVRDALGVPQKFPLTDAEYHEFKVEQGIELGNLTEQARAESARRAAERTMTPARLGATMRNLNVALSMSRSRDAQGRYVSER